MEKLRHGEIESFAQNHTIGCDIRLCRYNYPSVVIADIHTPFCQGLFCLVWHRMKPERFFEVPQSLIYKLVDLRQYL